MMIGTTFNEEKGEARQLLSPLLQIAVSDSKEGQEVARKFVEAVSAEGDEDARGADTFYTVIACKEVFTDLRNTKLTNGRFFTPTGANYCADAEMSASRRYNVADWPVTAPIYYFEGSDDPATPADLALGHFTAQTSSSGRQFLKVKSAGHNPFRISMPDCYKNVFGAIAAQSDFAAAVSGCKWPPGFELGSVKNGAANWQTLSAPVAPSVSSIDKLLEMPEELELNVERLRGQLFAPR